MHTFMQFVRSIVALAVLCGTTPLFAHQEQPHATGVGASPGAETAKGIAGAMPAESLGTQPPAPTPPDTGTMGIEEKLGGLVPLDVPFVNDAGDTVFFGSVVRGPTILCILFYKCPNACNLLLTGIADVLRSYSDRPQSAPNVVTMTVDERETITDARRARTMAFQAIQKPFPADKWHFLTGSAASIRAVTDAVGFRFVKRGDDFDHPLCIIILSPQGKVVRYIMGTDYLPADVTMSLMEASSGAVQPTVARLLRACFSVDPQSRRLVFNMLQVSGTVVFVLVGVFIAYLIISGNRRLRGKR